MNSDRLDETDRQLLELMQGDCTLSTQALAERVNLSQSPCWRRINRLQSLGYIRGRVAVLDREKLGMDVVVFATVNLATQRGEQLEAFERQVMALPEVVECYTMAGTWDYMLKVVVRDVRHYERFARERLSELENVREMHSHIAVTEIKNATALPIATQMS